MINKSICFILTSVALFVFLIPLFSKATAQEDQQLEITQEINSFELFWPVSAGKTMGDRYYSLKRLKEKMRSGLIFNQGKKADYQMFLVTKRVVEAEKLVKDGKNDLAIETLLVASESASDAYKNWTESKESGDTMKNVVDNINKQIDNIVLFAPELKKNGNSDVNSAIDNLMDKLADLQQKV